jgi:dienelactone hydrolase
MADLKGGRRHAGRNAALIAVAVVIAAALIAGLLLRGGSSTTVQTTTHPATSAHVTTPAAPPPPPPRPTVFAVGLRTITVVDPRRVIRLPGGATEARQFAVTVRYPARGPVGGAAVAGAPPARTNGPFPLVVFGHGFDITPSSYAGLLDAWARAGYVVAAPTYPLENPDAPGGPDERDLVNQPADDSLVITRMLSSSGGLPAALHGLADPTKVAVAGQSDGGDTALAVAYDPRYRDRRVRAAVILSGAEIPFIPSFRFPPGGPPLLATQGTADVVNPAAATRAFYLIAPDPKYLLTLYGAAHLPPYSYEEPQLGIVERTTTAFLNLYLAHGTLAALRAVGTVPGVSHLAMNG